MFARFGMRYVANFHALAAVVFAVVGCGDGKSAKNWQCQIGNDAGNTDYVLEIGCLQDFHALSSEPIDATISGARSVKVVLDTWPAPNVGKPADMLYFQNSQLYKIHHAFADKFLSSPDHQKVPALGMFNTTEYTSSERRFILGAVTYYEEPKLWVLQLSPYDTANEDMIAKLYAAVKEKVFFQSELAFHPTSEMVAAVAKKLPASVAIKTTDDIFAATSYQALNLGTTMGKLRYVQAANLDNTFLTFRDVVVLDRVPNDISVVAGMITEEFQTPLAHINVLAQTRGSPNMGLKGATTEPKLKALEGKWVELTVAAQAWTIREVTMAEADAWWEVHKPPKVTLPSPNLAVTELRDIENLVMEDPAHPEYLLDEISDSILAFGGKASNYGVLVNTSMEGKPLSKPPKDGEVPLPLKPAFAIPFFYYDQFMKENGFYAMIDAFLADPAFNGDSVVRDKKLAELRAAIMAAPVNQAFQYLLRAKLDAKFPGKVVRFRTSTNSEDLEGFPCAGCYESHSGDPADWEGSLLAAIKETWSGVWYFRSYEERSYRSVDQKGVMMALLVHRNFPMEEANGVAATANPFDMTGQQPALYVNVQYGGAAEVVHPPPGVTSDEFLYYYYNVPSRPVTYLAHSNLILPGETVLSEQQILDLGNALAAVQTRYSYAYGPAAGKSGWYGMEVDIKFDDEDDPSKPARLYLKQARPHPGRGE
jgi:pyruvate, water dikinase